jgi:NADH:ubiquinone oxidoreductase subunit 6 (subunit J)
LDLCLCVVVVGAVVVGLVVVVGLLVVVGAEEELPPLLPHPATATVLARMAAVVSMAVSGVLLMGRAPNLARGFGCSPYQPVV